MILATSSIIQLFETRGRDLLLKRASLFMRIVTVIHILLIFSAIVVSSPAIPKLPTDETELILLLEERQIDTFQYEQLLVYYALPLSVPQGELAFLSQIFPEAAGFIPDMERIETYQPFDNRQIQKMFNDFPILADIEPILRFNAMEARVATGEAIFGINKSNIDELKGLMARFRFKNARISAAGSASLCDTGALWQNRVIDVPLSTHIRAQIGNFRQPVLGDLFFGRFLPLESAKRFTLDNWLYGGDNTWNGVAVDASEIFGAPMLGVSAFGHVRSSERGVGGAVDFRVNKRIKLNAGITAFEIDDALGNISDVNEVDDIENGATDNRDGDSAKEYINYAHLYGEYRGKLWRIIVEAGLPLHQENVLPAISGRLSYRVKDSYAEYRYVEYSPKLSAPMSRVKRQMLLEIGEKESAQSLFLQKHSLKMTVPIFIPLVDMARFAPEVNVIEYGGTVKRAYGQADVRMRVKNADIAIKHSSKIYTTGADSVLHTSSVSLNLQTDDYPTEILISVKSIYGYYKNPRYTYTLEIQTLPTPNVVVTPFIRGKYVLNHEYRIGLKSEFHLYKKTWTAVAIELPVDAKGAGNVYIKGSSSYAF